MKKKALALAMACALACFGVFALSACGGSQAGSSSSSSAANPASVAPEGDKLVVGFDKEFAPYGYVGDDGQYTGFDLDLAQAVCEKLGWEYEAEAIDWDAKDALIEQGGITCIWNGFTHEGREGKYAFSGDYMNNSQVVVVKADSDINTLADLAGKTVLTQADSAALDVLNGDKKDLQDTFKGGKVQTIADFNNAFMQLESGTVDAIACDLSVATFQMNAKEGVFKQLDEILSTEHFAVGFKNDETGQALADEVTATLKELDAEGKVKEICEKYSPDVSYENWCLQ